jgi:hypothetical protein
MMKRDIDLDLLLHYEQVEVVDELLERVLIFLGMSLWWMVIEERERSRIIWLNGFFDSNEYKEE